MTDTVIEIQAIRKILPQSYPFLMIDRIVEYKEGESLKAIKNLTANEWFLDAVMAKDGHVAETLLIEAAAQAALCIYQMSKIGPDEARPKYILGKISCEFYDTIGIGHQLIIEAFANKMLEDGGYSEVILKKADKRIGQIEIFYKVIRKK